MQWWTTQQLKSKSPETRIEAINKLSSWDIRDSFPLLVRLLADPEATVRKTVIQTLSKIQEPPSLEPVVTLLQGDNITAREAAGAVLLHWKHPSGLKLLPALLGDGRADVRWLAARALQMCGWTPEKETDAVVLHIALGDFVSAAKAGPAALEPLNGALQDESCPQRRKVVQALTLIADARVIKSLILALKDSDPAVRVAAVEALGDIREIQATEALVTALHDTDAHVRVVAVTALGNGGDVNATPYLISVLGDSNWDVRKAAVEALGRLPDQRAVEPLSQLLKDQDHDVREAAAKALGEIGDTKAVERLVVALCDPQTSVRQAAAGALQRIEPQWEKSSSARRAIPQLKVALKDREYWVRQSAADVLQRISALPAFEPKLGGFSNPLHYRQQAALEALVVALCDTDRDLRLAAAEALGRIGDQRSIQALTRSLEDADEWVREACVGSLNLLGWNPAQTGGPRREAWT